MKRFIHDNINGLNYELVGDYYLPCLKAPESPKVGRFGLMYFDYLRNHKRVTYSGLLLSGKLNEHIEDIDRQAEEMFSQLVEQMKQAEGIGHKDITTTYNIYGDVFDRFEFDNIVAAEQYMTGLGLSPEMSA